MKTTRTKFELEKMIAEKVGPNTYGDIEYCQGQLSKLKAHVRENNAKGIKDTMKSINQSMKNIKSGLKGNA